MFMRIYLGGGVLGPNNPAARGVGGTGSGAPAVAIFGVGAIRGLGFQVAQSGNLGFGGSGGMPLPGGGPGGGACCLSRGLRSAFLCTTRQAGLAGGRSSGDPGGASGSGSGAGAASGLGFQSGAYSPPAPCLDFTLINSAISNCNALRSSLSFPTSLRRMRTSLARAFEKSLRYFGGAPLYVDLLDIDNEVYNVNFFNGQETKEVEREFKTHLLLLAPLVAKILYFQ